MKKTFFRLGVCACSAIIIFNTHAQINMPQETLSSNSSHINESSQEVQKLSRQDQQKIQKILVNAIEATQQGATQSQVIDLIKRDVEKSFALEEEPTVKSSNKKVLYIIGAIAGVAALGVIIYFIYSHITKQTQPSSPPATPAPVLPIPTTPGEEQMVALSQDIIQHAATATGDNMLTYMTALGTLAGNARAQFIRDLLNATTRELEQRSTPVIPPSEAALARFAINTLRLARENPAAFATFHNATTGLV
jgi:hypothetical protein